MDVPREPSHSPRPVGGDGAAPRGRAMHQLGTLLGALAASSARRGLALMAGAIVLVICGNAAAQVWLNTWFGPFYDALERHDVNAFIHQLLVFLVIVAILLMLVVGQTWLHEMIKLRLREWLTHELADQWLLDGRVYRLGFAGEIAINPDQRMQDDARRLTELSADLVIGLLQASLLLVSFVGVLWVLSAQVVFEVGERSFTIPGYMVWCALAYAGAGSWLAWRVGRPLILLNAERYSREAQLRFALVRIAEHGESIALYRGEAGERRELNVTIERVVQITKAIANGLARLTWVTSGYGWLAIVVPIVVAAPGYFNGDLTLGGLMVVVAAFNPVQQALRWFVDNFSRIADWRATLERIVAFRQALLTLEEPSEGDGRIRYVDEPGGRLVVEDLTVLLPDGSAALESRLEVAPGERVLILGDPRSGKSTLFRALAGLWPSGSGTIRVPARSATMFMPQRPYLPLGTLQAAVAYPDPPGRFEAAAIGAALQRVGLDALLPALHQERRWDKELTVEEQLRLTFARLLVHAPRWVFLDEGMAALDEEHRRLLVSIFREELAGAAIVSTGSAPVPADFYTRTVRLVRVPGSLRAQAPSPLRPDPATPAAALGAAAPNGLGGPAA